MAGGYVLNNLSVTSDVEKIRAFLRSKSYASCKKNRRVPDTRKEYSVFGRPLKRIPRQFIKCVNEFTCYLSDTARKSFKITTRNGTEIKTKSVGYIHRWTDTYRKSILAKLYQLEASLTPEQLRDVTMITLTTSQRGEDQEECLLKLLDSYDKLFKLLRYHIGTIDYFYILEPHKTGYAHMHVIYMKRLTDNEKDIIVNAWQNKYKAGTEEGINFSEVAASEDGSCREGEISHFRSYVMKYLSKGLRSESMTKGELLFNSLLKKHRIRLWNCSRHFSQIMKKPEIEKSDDWECLKVEMYQDDEFISQVYPQPQITTYSFSPSAEPLRICPDVGVQADHGFHEVKSLICMDSDGLKCEEKVYKYLSSNLS